MSQESLKQVHRVNQPQTLHAGVAEPSENGFRVTANSVIIRSSLAKNRRIEMGKYLSLIGILLVLIGFHLGPNAEAQVVELDDGLLYASPALILGINFDFSGDDGLEFYPSLSAQVTGGMVFTGLMGGVLSHEESTIPMVGATFGYQFSLGHPNNLYLDLQGGWWPFGVGVGWAWQPSTKVSSFRSKLFFPSPLGLGIEYDSRKRLKPYLYGSVAPMLFLSSQ